MSKSVRLALGLAATVTMMAALATSASARNFSTTSQTIRATWSPLVFTDPFGNTISCPVTLEGSLHRRTIAKVTYTLIGAITEATVGTREQCTGGTSTILRETLPWHVRYFGFEGGLPNISKIITLISGASFRVFDSAVGATCLFTTRDTTREHGRGTFSLGAGGTLTAVEVSGEITSNERCAFGLTVVGRLSGRSRSLTVLNSTNEISITLI